MRILFVNPYYKPYLGGIERVIEKLGAEFLNSGEVEAVGVLTTYWKFPRKYLRGLPPEEEMDGFEVFRVSSWPKSAPPFYQVPLVWFSPFEFRRVIREFKPDVIQLMTDKWFWGNFWAIFWGRRMGAKVGYSLSFHHFLGQQSRVLLSDLRRLFLRAVNAFLTRRVDFVHVITNYEKDLVKKAYYTPQRKLKVIPWGVLHPSGVISRRQEVLHPTGVERGIKIKILAVGRLSRHKGQSWLIGVFADLQEVVKRPTRLILAGADEHGEILNLKSQIANLGLEDVVDILGEVSEEELGQLYQQADIFALFPEYEAFGLVFLEAMAYGIPVATHQVGALKEVLKKGAILTSPYNRIQAQVVLAKLIEDDRFRRSLGQEAKDYLQSNYSWPKTARAFLALYNKI